MLTLKIRGVSAIHVDNCELMKVSMLSLKRNCVVPSPGHLPQSHAIKAEAQLLLVSELIKLRLALVCLCDLHTNSE